MFTLDSACDYGRAPVLAITTLLVPTTLLLAACSPTTTRSLDIEPSEVASVELYFYGYSDQPGSIDRVEFTDRGLIEEQVSAFTDVPVSKAAHTLEDIQGERATGIRFVLTSGETVELTQVFVDFYDVVLLWPDGQLYSTEWGSPNVDYFTGDGAYVPLVTFTPDVDASLLPVP